MNKNSSAAGSTELKGKLMSVPIELKLYAFFAVVISLFGILFPVVGPQEVWFRIQPFTGWLPAFGYMFTLYFIYALVFKPLKRNQKVAFRDGIIKCLKVFCLLSIFNSLFHLFLFWGTEPENPMLRTSPWQPVLTILLPISWIMILKSPRITQFCDAEDDSD